MKKLIMVTLLVFSTALSYGQEYIAVTKPSSREVSQVAENLYRVIVKCNEGNIEQTGFYTLENDEFVKTGLWKMYNDEKKVVSTAEFSNNQIVWIRADGRRVTADQIKLHRLQNRVRYLEQRLMVVAGTN